MGIGLVGCTAVFLAIAEVVTEPMEWAVSSLGTSSPANSKRRRLPTAGEGGYSVQAQQIALNFLNKQTKEGTIEPLDGPVTCSTTLGYALMALRDESFVGESAT